MFATTNLKKGTHRNPVIIEAIAPASVYPFQNSVRIITGQKDAAIPDQPKMTIQKTVRSGVLTAIINAIIKANMAITKVTILDILDSFSSGI